MGLSQNFLFISAWRTASVFLDQHSHCIHLQEEVTARISLFFFPCLKRELWKEKKKNVSDFVRCSRWVHSISEVRRDLYSESLLEPNPAKYDYTRANSAIEKCI